MNDVWKQDYHNPGIAEAQIGITEALIALTACQENVHSNASSSVQRWAL